MKYEKFGKFLKSKIALKMSIGEFERRIGKSHTTVWQWTSGQSLPSYKEAIRIEILLGIRKFELLNEIYEVYYKED